MARRLPIYFVLDVSESMAGEPISQMEEVIDHVLADMRRDPHALESVWFSQIVFAAKPMTLSPLKEITGFTPNSLPIGGGTGIGELLKYLMQTLKTNTQIDAATGKADWKPIVYLMTDGRSTDSTQAAVQEWTAHFKDKCLLVAISLGVNSDLQLLKQLTENVVVFMDTTAEAYSKYAAWISRSISESIKVSSSPVHSDEKPIAELERGLIESVEAVPASSHTHDEQTVVLVGRCQKSKKPYLLRYDKSRNNLETASPQPTSIRFTGATALKESYFELSSTNSETPKIDVQKLEHPGRCIHCGGSHAIVLCEGCKKVSCGAEEETWTCPWCGVAGRLSALEGPGFTDRGLG